MIAKRKKILLQAIFPAPYRSLLFSKLSNVYDATIIYDKIKGKNRKKEWFNNSSIHEYIRSSIKGTFFLLKSIFNLRNYDLLIIYDYFTVSGIFLILLARVLKVKFAINSDGAFDKKNSFKSIAKRFLLSKSSFYLANGLSARKYFLKYGATNEKIFDVCLTTLDENDLLNEPFSEENKRNLKLELDLGSSFTVVYAGQFTYRKGVDILLKSFVNLPQNCQLILIGNGELQSSYEEFITTNSLKNVRILPFMSKSKLLKYMRASDVFVLPTREDIWGLVIIEALASGIPIITTNMCNAGIELIRDGINGYLIESNNPKELEKRIVLLHNELSLRECMSNNNIKLASSMTISYNFSLNVQAIEKCG